MKKIILLLIGLLLLTACSPTGNVVGSGDELTLKVSIPCSGHASLITGELYKLPGVTNVDYRTGHYFDVTYNPSITTEQDILNLDVFNSYPATLV
ncbi:lipoprotein [archaeon]|jgi:hypothetical protein|nr:lipoprotein [archaeon]MBT4397077.1 lipoprotein [archaeon]MBT4441196.1 lipoprotein [archaeon]